MQFCKFNDLLDFTVVLNKRGAMDERHNGAAQIMVLLAKFSNTLGKSTDLFKFKLKFAGENFYGSKRKSCE